jgi:xanthine dehydrogenase YagS FAD-binding subunit
VKKVCIAVYQGDMAPALIALGAKLQTTERLIETADFFEAGLLSSTALRCGELLTEIQIPIMAGQRSRYRRFAFRKSIDFPVVNLAIAVDGSNRYRICLGGVAPTPYRATKAETLLDGHAITPELAESAGLAAVEEAKPFEANAYKVQLIKTLVKRELLLL